MKWENVLKIAVRSLSKNRMRSLLTALGIIIGVAAVIVMVAVGEGSQARIEARIRALGANVIMIYGGASRAGGVSRGAGSINRLTLDDADKLAEEATLCTAVSPVVTAGGKVI
jgi:putative ABC transport system permease protein